MPNRAIKIDLVSTMYIMMDSKEKKTVSVHLFKNVAKVNSQIGKYTCAYCKKHTLSRYCIDFCKFTSDNFHIRIKLLRK